MTAASPPQRSETVFESNIPGTSCRRACPVEVPCVCACVRNELRQRPIATDKLRRCATDEAFEG
jgi:NADPH-dependent glutamate synthase beta subunit-like oxidoreductase